MFAAIGNYFLNSLDILFRVNWNAPLSSFPKDVPTDMPDLIFQIGSGISPLNMKANNAKLRY